MESTPPTFASLGVCQELLDACERLSYQVPTPIQAESLPYTLKGKDIIALAETGSGKTLAFTLPILQSLLDSPKPFYALVMSPTRLMITFSSYIYDIRELCLQIAECFEAVGSGIGLKTVVVVGGLDPMSQAIALGKKPHVVIGTPGRLLYHLENTKGLPLHQLNYLVLDEADKLLNMDFEQEINKILEIIPKTRRTFLFSATMTNKVTKLQRASLKDPVKIEVSGKYQTVKTLTQNYLFIPAKFKDCYLVYLLTQLAGNITIIFVQTCMNAIRVCLVLRNLGFKAVSINGQMSQVKRLGALNKFKSGESNILIATDVASRGLDIPNVDLVVNMDLPVNSKDYIHRVGRTARAGKAGRAISLVTQYDVESYLKIEHLINQKLELYKTEEEEVMIFCERVQEAQRIATHELKEIEGGGKDDDEEEGNAGGKRRMKGGKGKGKKGGNKKRKLNF